MRAIYNGAHVEETSRLLRLYGVKHIYVGALEGMYYDAARLSSFGQASGLREPACQSEQMKVCRAR